MQTTTEKLLPVAGLLKQIISHSSVENRNITQYDSQFGADELQAIRSKAIKALNLLFNSLEMSDIIQLAPSTTNTF